jgi:hypothetical protein
MTYVIIHGRGLQGLGSAITPEAADTAARALIRAEFAKLCAEWNSWLDECISGRLGTLRIAVGSAGGTSLPIAQHRVYLERAKSDVNGLWDKHVSSVVNDRSLPLAEVLRRMDDFSKSYGESLQGQIASAVKAADRASPAGMADTFQRSLRIVTKKFFEVIGEVAPDPLESPGLYAVGVGLGLFGLAYIWRSFR